MIITATVYKSLGATQAIRLYPDCFDGVMAPPNLSLVVMPEWNPVM
jgi:hypothetical protein